MRSIEPGDILNSMDRSLINAITTCEPAEGRDGKPTGWVLRGSIIHVSHLVQATSDHQAGNATIYEKPNAVAIVFPKSFISSTVSGLKNDVNVKDSLCRDCKRYMPPSFETHANSAWLL